MNLFHKVKKGMLDSTKTIKELSTEVSEMTRLKVSLSKDKAQLDEMYYNLGKILYAAFEENGELNSLPRVVLSALTEINDTHIRIQENESKLEALKGIVKCSQCGMEVDDGAKFCSNCGNQLISIPEEKASTEPDKLFLEKEEVVEDVEEFEEIKPE